MEQFKIEKNTPLPEKEKVRITKSDLPLEQMEQGDSIVLEKKVDEKVVSRWYARLKYFRDHYHIPGRFKLAKDTRGQLRVWKVAA